MQVVERFRDACQDGDLAGLIAVLADDVIGDFDAGGAIPGAPTHELIGAEDVAQQLLGSVGRLGARFTVADVNGQPGVVITLRDRIIAVLALGVRAERIDSLHGVGNPDKLGHLRRA